MITNVSIDKHAGEIATGRVYGGTIEKGTEIFFIGSHGKARIQQVGVYMGPERINTDKVPAGNIVAITGARNAMAGETVTNLGTTIDPFEGIEHISEPVVTVAVEAKKHQRPSKTHRSFKTGWKGRPYCQGRDQRRNRRTPHIRYGRTSPRDHNLPY
jgi:translation elongation factor EF-G